MKNSLQLLGLGLVLFLGACSVSPDTFLAKVKNTTMVDSTQSALSFGTFDATGKTITIEGSPLKYTFKEATDDNTGVYEIAGVEAIATTTDGKTGTWKISTEDAIKVNFEK